MAGVAHRIGRHTIFFSDHALDRWWERCEANGLHGRTAAMDLLRERLIVLAQEPRKAFVREPPVGLKISLFHRGLAAGFLVMGEGQTFVVNRNPGGDLVAATYLDADERTTA